MAEYTLKYINHRARYDAAAFIGECEQQYHDQVLRVAEEIAENSAHQAHRADQRPVLVGQDHHERPHRPVRSQSTASMRR